MADENLLLARLPPLVRERLQPRLQTVSLLKAQTLLDVGESARHAYFPTRGLFSLELESMDGSALELATVGREGMIGVQILLRDDSPPYRVIVRASALAWRISASALQAELEQAPALQTVLLQYSGRMLRQIGQAGLCHHSHTVSQRLSRWLLTASDHAQTDLVDVTHARLMLALGTARSALSKAIAELVEGETIWTGHGRILIRKRSRLEATACECYRTLRDEGGHLVAPDGTAVRR